MPFNLGISKKKIVEIWKNQGVKILKLEHVKVRRSNTPKKTNMDLNKNTGLEEQVPCNVIVGVHVVSFSGVISDTASSIIIYNLRNLNSPSKLPPTKKKI